MPMLTSSRISGVVLFGLAACLPGSRIGAFEGGEGARVEKAPLREPGKHAVSPKSTTPEMRLDVSIGICFTRSAPMCNYSGHGGIFRVSAFA